MPGTGKLHPSDAEADALVTIRFNKRRWLMLLGTLGPGILAASAGNDAGGIATYATAGARYGYAMLWALLLITVALAMIQEMATRMGAVTGKGLSSLIRERFGLRATVFAMGCLLVANVATTLADFAGVAAAAELFGVPRWLAVPVAAGGLWWLVAKGSFARVERTFMLLAFVFLSYVAAAFLARPDWSRVLHDAVVPNWPSVPAATAMRDHLQGYLLVLIATIGTTITPWMQFFLQASVVDKGVTIRQYGFARFDAFFGALTADLVSFFIIVATAAALFYPAMQPHALADAASAASALVPVAGRHAGLLFGVGLLGASLLAASVVPLATAYAVCEAFGFEAGLGKDFRRAPVFLGLYTLLIGLGALVAVIPGLPLLPLMLVAQDINGILLPVILVYMLRLVNDRRLMGVHVNGVVYNTVVWGMVVVVSLLTATMVVTSLWPT
ncbi:MAG: Nramp family divalent metal transporter [Candidatus Sericytochromatia bacterium]|nr:Nramp family divalent metal transporter [Candidatus Tanganyikabacteria bacterium]